MTSPIPPVNKKHLTDAQAKAILLKWPTVTTKLWAPPGGLGGWVRAQPKDGRATGPRIYGAGNNRWATQADGLWAHFTGLDCCDLVAIEVCGTIQNLNDKRSRYDSKQNRVLRVDKAWADEIVKGGQGRGNRSRRALAVTLPALSQGSVDIPIRFVSVLYALPNQLYRDWTPDHLPAGHEYFMPHSALSTFNSQDTQNFLKRMSRAAYFRSLPRNVRV